jgi:diacylglycerol kinase (ATP)
MKRCVHVILNPAAGGGRCGRRWPRIAEQLRQHGLEVVTRQTSGRGDAVNLARQAARSGATDLAVAGGDGTINEAINGLHEHGSALRPELALTVLPCGTGSDFARNLGIRRIRQAIAALVGGRERTVDLGLLHFQRAGIDESRYFVNSADVGYGAETAAWVNGSSRPGGRFAYLIGGVRTILSKPPRPASITVDGVCVHDGPLGMVVVANGRYHAGGMELAPSASLDDGRLDVLLIGAISRFRLLGSLLPRVYFGAHVGQPGVRQFVGRNVRIMASQPLRFEVDGEQPGTTDLVAEVVPSALRVRVPVAGAE